MKSKIIAALKIILPLGFGIFIIWLFYDALCPDQKEEMFSSLGEANYLWVIIGLTGGLISHISRAYRWKFQLEPLGYKPRLIQMYNSVMIGYLVNLIFPRAGEASRAGVLDRTEGIPFQKGFGTIIAERVVDLVMLGGIALLALGLQFDKIDLFKAKIDGFEKQETCGNADVFPILGSIVTYLILAAIVGGIVLFIVKPSFREKIKSFLRGVKEGLFSIFKMDKKLAFIGHTLLIWVLYVFMHWASFMAIEETSHLGLDAVLAGFCAGAVGIVLVQGGIGVYPIFVAIIVSIYLPGDALVHPAALALGWLAWISQTIMMIVMGLLSMAISRKNPNLVEDGSTESDQA